jgi:hypothetical protein
LAAIRRRFRPAEMMLLASSAMGRKIDPVGFAEQVRRDFASGGIFAMIVKKYDIKAEYLVSKLASTPAEMMEVLATQLDEWQRLDIGEMMASNHLPSISTLQRLGLIEPDKGDVAWGWFCFRNRCLAIYEYALHHPERMPPTESRTTDDLAAELVRLVEASLSPLDDETITDCVYRIVKVTGWRRCLVVADDRGVRVTEISVKALLRDRYEGTLKGVVLAGVNAPDSVGH